MNGEGGVGEHAERKTGGVGDCGFVARQMQQWKVAGADEFDCAVLRGASHDKGGVLAGQSALGKNAVSSLHHAVEWEIDIGEAAEGGVEMAHEHGRGNT